MIIELNFKQFFFWRDKTREQAAVLAGVNKDGWTVAALQYYFTIVALQIIWIQQRSERFDYSGAKDHLNTVEVSMISFQYIGAKYDLTITALRIIWLQRR